MASTATRVRLRPCVVCEGAESKYKCPECESATCSLACSKQHKSAEHGRAAESGQGEASGNGTTMQPLLPSLQLGKDEVLQAPGAHRFTNIARFVPLNQYSDANMLEDFEYLQFLGRSVTSLGRDLIKKGWLKTGAQEGASSSTSRSMGANGKSAPAGFRTERLPAELRNRQQLERGIRRTNVPIMLLPDGMSTRKENQTRWKAQTEQLQCTMQFTFPSGTASSSSSTDRRARRAIVHHIPWTRAIADVALNEVNKRLRSSAAGTDTGDSPWQALLGRDVTAPRDDKPLTMESISDRVALVVAVHSASLRNESSAKFLEWWQRQVRNGMVKADGLELDEEKRAALEQARRGAWAPIEGLHEEQDHEWPGQHEASGSVTTSTPVAASATESAVLPPAGLLSVALLSRMQTQRDARKKEKNEAAAAEAVKDEQQQEVVGDSETPAKRLSSSTVVRSVLILNGDETVERLLRGLPKGHAIVEYPHVEVWDKLKLLRLVAQGKLKRVYLENRKDGGEKRPAGAAVRDEQVIGAPIEPAMPAAKKARVEQSSLQSGLMGLSAYASSSEEEDDVEECKEQISGDEQDDAPEGFGGSLSDLARMLRASADEQGS